MPVVKIVITGGPCAGKTTGLSWIRNAFTKQGWTVLIVPETATELITGGVAPWTCGSNVDYQKCQVRLQLEKERIFQRAASTMSADRILIVCDRGVMDNRAYMDEREFAQVLEDIGADEDQLRSGYDAVFHLVTAAKGAEEFYTTENNTARYETAEQAAALDDRFIAAWTGHPYLRVIDNSDGFDGKLRRLIGEIRSFLGEPEPPENKRAFLIEYPDLNWLESFPDLRKAEIIQTYLISREGEELRVCQWREKGNSICFRTYRRPTDDGKRIEVEERLTQEEYLDLLMEVDPSRHPVRKTRYYLTWEGRKYEVDVFRFWNDRAIAEVELGDETGDVRFPEGLKVIREITGEEDFNTSALARL